jgi:hypothetical protein
VTWRAVAVVAVFSALPLAVFLSENRNEVDLEGTLLLFPLGFLVAGLVAVLVAGERAAVLFAVALFVTFQYAGIDDALGGGTAVALGAWAVLLGVALLAAHRLSRSPLAANWLLAVGVALTAINALQYATFSEAGEAGGEARPHAVAEEHAGDGGPDVYFFLLDGYGRADELRRLAGHDQGPFLRGLRERGFDVADDALASYPMTLASVTTTLSLDYTLPVGSRPGRDVPYRRLEGDNVAAASFRRLGYDFVHATDYDKYRCEGYEDVCIDPARRAGVVGTTERAFLEATPLAPALPASLRYVGRRVSVLTPDGIVREVDERRDKGPVFVYAHLMTPHPPYRYDEACRVRSAFDGDLDQWGEPDGEAGRLLRSTLRCTNDTLLRAVDLIARRDPEALIFIEGDHGTAFGLDFKRPLTSWPDADLRQRYAILSAARLPRRCAERAAPRVPVNTFRLALACVTGERVAALPERHFALGYEDGDRVGPLPVARLTAGAPSR